VGHEACLFQSLRFLVLASVRTAYDPDTASSKTKLIYSNKSLSVLYLEKTVAGHGMNPGTSNACILSRLQNFAVKQLQLHAGSRE
jgi:hypothetical protein